MGDDFVIVRNGLPIERFCRWILPGALALYCLWGGLLILQNPGFQYDEALLVLGSVHMRHSRSEIALPHDPNSWVCPAGRCFPLMTVRYVGAVKEYLCLPLFAAFGTSAEIVRIVSMLLGAVGIWGVGSMVARHVRPLAGAASACLIAMNPAYADLTVFDNGTVAIWMGAMGLLCLALSRYFRLETAGAAFWLGASMGLGVWARANFLWLLIAMFAAGVIVLGWRILAPLSHWGAAALGGLLGGFPFLIYQVVSRGGTWEALGMFDANQTLGRRLAARFVMFAETLLSDREHRAIWSGPAIPEWQRWLFPMVVLTACGLCLAARRLPWARAFALCFLFLASFLFLTRVIVAEHHLIVLVPLAAVVTVLASSIVAQYTWGRAVVAALAVVYFGSALYWQVAAVRGLGRSGGVGQWSNAIFALTEYLEQKYPDREIEILDWGLQNNLFVLSNGKIHSREVYLDVTGPADPRWAGAIRRGGIFLMNGPANRQFPAASMGFLEALARTRPAMRRFTVPQRSGVPYATIFEIEPNTAAEPLGTLSDDGISSSVLTGDPRFAKQLEGFNQIEPGGWRWTMREFAVTLRAPAGSAQAGARLTLQLFVPEAIIRKLGPITLTARIHPHRGGTQAGMPVLQESETYATAGQHTFTRDLEAGWLKAGANRVEFTLDKYVAPGPEDSRERGVVVSSASLEPR